MSGDDSFEIGNVRVYHETEKAILFGEPDCADDDKIWLPKSLIHGHYGFTVVRGNSWIVAVDKNEIGSIDVAEWWAEQEGFA